MLFKIKKMRPAIAMIELIFAIVIMGIVLMSAPRLISTAAKSGYAFAENDVKIEVRTDSDEIFILERLDGDVVVDMEDLNG